MSLLVSPVSVFVLEFVRRVCVIDRKAGSRLSFCEGERGLFWPMTRCYL